MPLLYDFYRQEYPQLERCVEVENDEFEKLKSKHIIDFAMEENDELCMKVVNKFT